MAKYLHTNDKRKIVNALFKSFKSHGFDSTPSSMSDITSGKTGLALRFKPIIIWVFADQQVLDQRIRKRVNKMIDLEDGLTEVFHVFDTFTDGGSDLGRQLDFSKGILQAIGYKEFYDYYLGQRSRQLQGNEEDKITVERPSLEAAKERLSSKTLQYALYQSKWLRKRILPIFAPDRPVEKPNLLWRIELNDPRDYEAIAVGQAITFIRQMRDYYEEAGDQFSLEKYAEHILEEKAEKFASWKKFTCEFCKNMEINGQHEWERHL